MALRDLSREDWLRLARDILAVIGLIAIVGWLKPGHDYCGDMKRIQQEVDDLRTEVDRFRGGKSDWRDIVENVDEVTAQIESVVEDCQCSDDDEVPDRDALH